MIIFRRRRPLLSVRPFVRPAVRPVVRPVVVRSLSVRPRRRCPWFVRPPRRPYEVLLT